MNLERNLSHLPKPLLALLLLSLAMQILAKQLDEQKTLTYSALEEPASLSEYQVISLGSTKLLAQLQTLALQLHDNQQGKHYNYRYLDYDVLSRKLLVLQALSLGSDYPALLASRVFVNTSNKQQLAKIIDTVMQLYEMNPEVNWRWLAELTVLAKYHLNDANLALSMAKKLNHHSKALDIPQWARDLEFLMLENLSQYESAIYIVEQTLKNKRHLSNDEVRFLQARLSVLKQKSVENSTK